MNDRESASRKTIDLAFESYGQGSTPLVVLHGLFGSRRNWRAVARHLVAQDLSSLDHESVGAQIFAVDQRHHGDSPKEGDFDLYLMAEDVCRFIRSRVGKPAVVLGHSMGGRIAVKTFTLCPELVSGLILVDITPFKLRKKVCDDLRDIIEAMRLMKIEEIATRKEAETRLHRRIESMEVVRFLLQNIRRNDGKKSDDGENVDKPGVFRWILGLEAINRRFDGACESVLREDDVGEWKNAARELPVLCLRGGESDFFPEEEVELLKKWFPAATFRSIEGAGHWLHVEKRGEFVEMVFDFLSGLKR